MPSAAPAAPDLAQQLVSRLSPRAAGDLSLRILQLLAKRGAEGLPALAREHVADAMLTATELVDGVVALAESAQGGSSDARGGAQ